MKYWTNPIVGDLKKTVAAHPFYKIYKYLKQWTLRNFNVMETNVPWNVTSTKETEENTTLLQFNK